MEKKKILIVDDEEHFGKMVKLNLEGTGRYAVRVETQGKQAFAAAKVFKPDLILLDVIMPDADGGEVAQQIKTDKDLNNTPIVFLTAIVKKNEIAYRDGSACGYPFIAKPVTVKELINRIEKTINR